MSTEDKLNEIIRLVEELNRDTEGISGTLIVCADPTEEISLLTVKGNVKILSAAVIEKMRSNPQFERLMLAIMADHLVNDPEKKRMFMQGLNLTNNLPGVN